MWLFKGSGTPRGRGRRARTHAHVFGSGEPNAIFGYRVLFLVSERCFFLFQSVFLFLPPQFCFRCVVLSSLELAVGLTLRFPGHGLSGYLGRIGVVWELSGGFLGAVWELSGAP